MKVNMKKILLIAFLVSLLFMGFNSAHAKPIPLDYEGNPVIYQKDLNQNPGAEKLLEKYWKYDVSEANDIKWSETVESDGSSVVEGKWKSSQNLVGISWKAGLYWQVFALDDNESWGYWNLNDLWKTAGKTHELSNIKGYIGSFSVNEPGTMLLLGFGLIGLAGLGRKRRLKK
jgi:hypothetical protein